MQTRGSKSVSLRRGRDSVPRTKPKLTTNRAMPGDFRNVDIISEIERHPALYDRFSSEYKNRTLKENAWWTATENLVGKKEWASKNNRHKNEARRFVQRRWKSLRDTFTRSLKNQQQGKGKRYVFEKQMSFLLPFLHEQSNSYYSNNFTHETDEVVHQEDSEDSASQLEAIKKINSPEVIIKTEDGSDLDENSTERIINGFAYDETIHRHMSIEEHPDDKTHSSMNDFDPEKLFLLSLLPSLKLVNPRDRLKAKIKMMEALEPFVQDV